MFASVVLAFYKRLSVKRASLLDLLDGLTVLVIDL